jgi:hypothetical protein
LLRYRIARLGVERQNGRQEPERIGVHLSEEQQLHPEQSTDALVVQQPAVNAS